MKLLLLSVVLVLSVYCVTCENETTKNPFPTSHLQLWCARSFSEYQKSYFYYCNNNAGFCQYGGVYRCEGGQISFIGYCFIDRDHGYIFDDYNRKCIPRGGKYSAVCPILNYIKRNIAHTDPHRGIQCQNGQPVQNYCNNPAYVIVEEGQSCFNMSDIVTSTTTYTTAPTTRGTTERTTTHSPDLICKGHSDGFIVDQKDPRIFHECSHGVKITTFYCQSEHIFDEIEQACVFAHKEDFKCSEKDGVFPYPGHKDRFLQCFNYVAYLRNCAKGKLFDQNKKKCV